MEPVSAVLSVDLEFFQHTPAYRTATGTANRPGIGCEGVEFLLDAFDDADASATFFTVSDIVDSHPHLVERIVTEGHEIGSHTHSHRHLSELSPTDRRHELVESRERLAAATGATVEGFRAPSFDIADDHFESLADAGYTYDSSVVSSRSIPGWYGGEFDTRSPTPATAIEADAPAGLMEVPVSVMPRLRLPLTGTWIRFFGVRYTLLGMRLLARRGIPPMLYVHPWELVDLPDIEGVPSRIYVRSGEYMRDAVARLLDTSFEFVPAREIATQARDDVATAASNG